MTAGEDGPALIAGVVAERTAMTTYARRQATWAAAIVATPGVLLLLLHVLGLDAAETPDNGNGQLTISWPAPGVGATIMLTCLIAAAVLAVVAWRAEVRRRWIVGAVQDVGRRLEDRAALAAVLDELGATQHLGPDWTEDDLTDAVEHWSLAPARALPRGLRLRSPIAAPTLRDLAPIAGAENVARLAIASGLDHGLLAARAGARYRRVASQGE